MGQQQTREHGSPGSSGFHHQHRRMSASASGGALSTSLSASSLAPPPPPPLPAHLADTVQVDHGGLVPTGVYTGPQDYDQHFVRQNVVDRRLAPFCKGSDDDDDYADHKFNCECPICFLSYPTPLNFSRCCRQAICTECFVQMKRADPTSHNPPSSEPRSCPFCVEPDFGVAYLPPEAIEKERIATGASTNDATDATNFAERAIGTGGVNAAGVAGKYKMLPPDDPDVITVDQVRPDWQFRLAQAEAAVARRANRRVIMRQVGDRLIPIGISSSRMGADLQAAADSGRINLNGPGGSIILNDGQMWPGANTVTTSRRRSSRPSRGAEDLPDLARMMRMGSGEDMEEIMMMEAMRLSLLEHEEQQRKQAEQEKARQKQEIQAATESANATPSRKPPAAAQSVLEESQGAETSRPPLPPQAPVNATSLGISQSMMDELSELVEEGAPSSRSVRSPAPAPEPVPVPQPVASMGSAFDELHLADTSTQDTGADASKHPHVQFSTNNPSAGTASSPVAGSPSAPAFTRSRIVNPNNPFRRSMGEPHS